MSRKVMRYYRPFERDEFSGLPEGFGRIVEDGGGGGKILTQAEAAAEAKRQAAETQAIIDRLHAEEQAAALARAREIEAFMHRGGSTQPAILVTIPVTNTTTFVPSPLSWWDALIASIKNALGIR